MNKFLIKTPGRTGSHIILEWLQNNPNNFVDHNQTAWVPKDPENYALIISKRRDWFDHCCSKIISANTNQYGPYDYKEKFTINVDLEYMIITTGGIKILYDTFEKEMLLYNWNSTHVVYYEDIKFTQKSLSILDNTIADNTGIRENMRSPYDFKSIIVDYDKLKQEYLEWLNFVGLENE